MRTIEDNRAVLAAVLVMVASNGLFLSANGLFMLVAPLTWFELVPGVTDTGFFTQHFVRDIGIIQLFLGVAFIVGLLRPEGSAERRVGKECVSPGRSRVWSYHVTQIKINENN